jgi:hypothetical protein
MLAHVGPIGSGKLASMVCIVHVFDPLVDFRIARISRAGLP